MAYELQWGSDKPGHFVFLIDLSGSMEDKIDYVINSVQQTLRSISAHCLSGVEVKERVSVSVYGYNDHIVELLKPNTSAKELDTIIRSCKKTGNPIFDKEKEAKPDSLTNMRMAFDTAKKDIENWINMQEDGLQKGHIIGIPSPIVINVTDGYPYEGKDFDQEQVFSKTVDAAKSLMSIKTQDGNVRLFNIHYDPKAKNKAVCFPHLRPTDDDRVTQFLFDASSDLSNEEMVLTAKNYFQKGVLGAKCMISYVKEVSNLIRFLEWGSSR